MKANSLRGKRWLGIALPLVALLLATSFPGSGCAEDRKSSEEEALRFLEQQFQEIAELLERFGEEEKPGLDRAKRNVLRALERFGFVPTSTVQAEGQQPESSKQAKSTAIERDKASDTTGAHEKTDLSSPPSSSDEPSTDTVAGELPPSLPPLDSSQGLSVSDTTSTTDAGTNPQPIESPSDQQAGFASPAPASEPSTARVAQEVEPPPALSLAGLTPIRLNPFHDLQPPPRNMSNGEKSPADDPVADSINFAIGEYFHKETLFVLPGIGIPLEFTLSYNSIPPRAPTLTRLGQAGWFLSVMEFITLPPEPGAILLLNGEGRGDFFRQVTPEFFRGPEGIYAEIRRTKDGVFVLRDRYGLTKRFDPQGKLIEIADRHHPDLAPVENKIRLIWDDEPKLVQVIDTRGKTVDLFYFQEAPKKGLLREIRDFTGRSWLLDYEFERLTSISWPETEFVSPTGEMVRERPTKRFRYPPGPPVPELSDNLLQVIDQQGGVPVENTYDNRDRVIRQRWGTGTIEISYDLVARITSAIDRNGNRVSWVHDEIPAGQVKAPGHAIETRLETKDHGTLVTQAKFNRNSEMTRLIFPKGNAVLATYDEENPDPLQQGNLLEIRRIAALSAPEPPIILAFTYEPFFNQVKTVRDPRGFVTRFFFDYEETHLGDLNADGRTDQKRGNVVRISYPTATLPDGTSQQIETILQYNDRGQMILSIDGEANRALLEYHPEGHPLAHFAHRVTRAPSRPEESSTEFIYDQLGNVIGLRDPQGHLTQYRFNALNQLIELTAPAPFFYRTELRYDARGNLVGMEVENITAEGRRDPANPVIETRFAYNLLNNLVERADEVEEGRFLVSRFVRDAIENITETVLPRGNRIRDLFDERDLMVSRTTGAGTADASTESFVYDVNGNLEKRIDGNGHATTTQYDRFDRPVEVIDALGSRVVTSYDASSNVTSVARFGSAGSMLSRVEQTYDAVNLRVRRGEAIFEEPGGPIIGMAETRFEHDRNGMIRAIRDPLGRITRFDTDAINRVIRRHDPLGNVIETVFDRSSNPILVREIERLPDGSFEIFTTRKEFDSLNRIVATVDNIGSRTEFGYDSRNNQTRILDAEGNVVRKVVDGLSRVIAIVMDLRQGGTVAQNRGMAGAVIGQIVTQTRYNDNGFPEALIDDKGNTTRHEYNARDLGTAEIYPDRAARTWSYDRKTNVLETVDGNGTRVVNRYNDVDLLVRREIVRARGVEGATFENFLYDGRYRIILAENDFARTTFKYDSLSRVIEETQQIHPFAPKTIKRSFDGTGNKTSLTYPSGRLLRIVPDALNRIDRIEEISHPFLAGQNPLMAKYGYAGPERLVRREYGNGTFLVVTYDAVKRPVRWEHRTADPFREIPGSKASGLIAGFEYVYDRVHNKRMESFLHRKGQPGDVFRYDSFYRLVDAALEVEEPLEELALPGTEDLERRQTWTLDGVGNWTRLVEAQEPDEPARAISFAVNPLNQYTAIDVITQSHDANGNLIERVAQEETIDLLEEGVASSGEAEESEGTDLLRFLFVYDYRNQLIRAEVQEFDKGDGIFETKRLIHSGYDAIGRRIFRAVEGHASQRGEDASISGRDRPDRGRGKEQGAGHDQFLAFYWDNRQLIEERDELDRPVRLYTLGSGVDEWIAIDVVKDFPGRFFLHGNSLGSTAALTDATAQVVERVTYTPHGHPEIAGAHGGGNRPRSGIGNRMLFTGREFDFEAGLYDYRARTYDPLTGRFLSRDLLRFDRLFNRYRFLNNSPTNFVDPHGLWPEDYHIAITEEALKENGVPEDIAKQIAQAVADQDDFFNSWFHHFLTEDAADNAITNVMIESPGNIGTVVTALHELQDSRSPAHKAHATPWGFGFPFGHGLETAWTWLTGKKDPEDPTRKRNRNAAAETKRLTFEWVDIWLSELAQRGSATMGKLLGREPTPEDIERFKRRGEQPPPPEVIGGVRPGKSAADPVPGNLPSPSEGKPPD